MYIGLDIGTSGTKAALINESGATIKFHQVNYDFYNIKNGYRELDAVNVWNAVKTCLNMVGKSSYVKTITVSSLGEAIIPIDKLGNPLSPSITGTDVRGAEELERILSDVASEKLTDITGLNISTIYSANKICWLKKNNPEIYEKAWKIVTFQDYVIFRLTNSAIIDYSMASRTLLFDINNNKWSDELLSITGIEKNKLSKPVRAGTIVGNLKSGIAKELGFIGEVDVVVGTHDHICNAIGSGSINDGDCTNTVGTTEGLTYLLSGNQISTDAIGKYHISCEPFVLEEMYNTVAWINTSGVLLKWFVKEFIKDLENEELINAYTKLNKKMDEDPTNLLIMPHFSGAATPHMDSMSKGAILGLTLATKKEDIYKALIEGVNFELKLIIDCLKKAGYKISKLTATGGALSEQLLQIKADVLGQNVHTVENKQTGTLGGAIIGAVAIGDFNNITEAISSMVIEGKTFKPDSKKMNIYQKKASIYEGLYNKLAEINHEL